MDKCKIAVLGLTIGVVWFIIDTDRRILRSILKVSWLPFNTKILDRSTWAWTDYREQFLIAFDGDYRRLMKGRAFTSCQPPSENEMVSAGLDEPLIDEIQYCYITGDWQSEEGSVTIFVDKSKSRAVIIFDQD